MLEEFAINLFNQDQVLLSGVGIAFYVAGFFLALWLRSGKTWSLRRVPFFILSASVFLAVSFVALGWLASFAAIKAGVYWLLMLTIFACVLAGGFAYGFLSHARSVSAYGDGGSAWFGIVPVANLILVFKAPANKAENTGILFKAGNFFGVVLGVLILALGNVVSKEVDRTIERAAIQASEDPELVALSIDAMLRSNGLVHTLAQMASEVPPGPIDEVTSLISVEGDGQVIRYTYRLSSDVKSFPSEFHNNLIEGNCSENGLVPILRAGAVIEHLYMNKKGHIIGTYSISQDLCDSPPPVPDNKLAVEEIERIIDETPMGGMYSALKMYFADFRNTGQRFQ